MGNTISPAEVQYQILEGLLLQNDATKEVKDKTIELFQKYKKYFEELFKDDEHKTYKDEYLGFIDILITLVEKPPEESVMDVDAEQQTEIGTKEKDSSRRVVTFNDNVHDVPASS